MRDVFFGLGLKEDDGSDAAVAINRHGTILEVHKNEYFGHTLFSRIGAVNGSSVRWRVSTEFTTGLTPSCALNANGVAVEVHNNEGRVKLYYSVGRVGDGTIAWGEPDSYDGGVTPAVALTDAGIAVEIHQTEKPQPLPGHDRLYFRVGPVEGDTIRWGGATGFANGHNPRVAVNNRGDVVAVYTSDGKIRVRTGTLQAAQRSIDFHDSKPIENFDIDGDTTTSVALGDDGTVIVVASKGIELFQCVGALRGDNVGWFGLPAYYDDGRHPTVALAADLAIEMHQGEALDNLWFATSLLTDRANWMQQRLPLLGGRTLRQLVLPGSHDSGMYLYGISVLGKTQSLSFYDQLRYGIRWFDVRFTWDADERTFYIYHELENVIRGPKLSEMLDDLRRFASEGPKELAIFKLSHFKNIDAGNYPILVEQIRREMAPWLYESLPEGKRLADVTLSEYIASRNVYLFAVDSTMALDPRVPGFWCYRDAGDTTAMDGDLRVYDVYADKMFASEMEDDQRDKYDAYDGLCKYEQQDGTIVVTGPCDLFMNDWVVTSLVGAGVWLLSKDPNRHLGEAMSEGWTIPNSRGFPINIVYVDYVEFARVTDVVLFMNGTPPSR